MITIPFFGFDEKVASFLLSDGFQCLHLHSTGQWTLRKRKKSDLLPKKNMPYLQHGVKPNRCICTTSEEKIPVIRWTVNWKHRPKVRREGKRYRGTQRNGALNICKRTKDSVKEIVQFYLVVHEHGIKINRSMCSEVPTSWLQTK